MDSIAKWMGYVKMVYYTKKLSYFKKVNDEFEFVDTVKEYNPKLKPDQFMQLLNHAIDKGAIIKIEKIHNKISKFFNHQVTVEVGNCIITKTNISYQHAIVEALIAFLQKDMNNKKQGIK